MWSYPGLKDFVYIFGRGVQNASVCAECSTQGKDILTMYRRARLDVHMVLEHIVLWTARLHVSVVLPHLVLGALLLRPCSGHRSL